MIDISKIDQLPQRQDSLSQQLADLRIVANRLGMYDASDYLRNTLETNNPALLEGSDERIVPSVGGAKVKVLRSA